MREAPRWQMIGWREYALVAPDGKIIGTVTEHSRRYAASTTTRSLGDFVSEESAKAAVERALRMTFDWPSTTPSRESTTE